MSTCVPASCGDGFVREGVEDCDDGNADNTDTCLDTCIAASCGDGYVGPGEDCDDGNMNDNDGCRTDCTGTAAIKVVSGERHTCALWWDGNIKCWGLNNYGQLGYGHTQTLGDDETPDSVGFVNLGGTAVDVTLGWFHTCALLDDATVKCWGRNTHGELGYGNTTNIADPSFVGPVSVGDDVSVVKAGTYCTCVLTDQQTMRCWGKNTSGKLGIGHINNIGDNELPSSIGPITLGGNVVDFSGGGNHLCALLANGTVRCWGHNASGELGQGNTLAIGDNELPNSVPVVSLGNTPVVALSLGALHSCALHDNGTVRCWGYNSDGRLGYGHANDIGDNELPSSVGTVSIGGAVDQLFTGYANTCVRIGSELKCWGDGSWGMNGYSSTSSLGDNELPSSYGMIDLGMAVTSVTTNLSRHTCAMGGTELRCWGRNFEGQLGYGHTNHIGDNEVPAAAGSVPYF